MTRPTIAEATHYFQSLGLVLEPIQWSHYRYRLSRIDGMGAPGHSDNFSQVWSLWRTMAGFLLREAAWATRILEEARGSPETLAVLLAWLRNGDEMPDLVKQLVEPTGSKSLRLIPRWREAVRPWMAITPINHLTLVPTMAALIRPGLQLIAPAEWQQCFNLPSVLIEAAMDGHGPDHPSGKSQVGVLGATGDLLP